MGYQNNERPDDSYSLLYDAQCDLSDLIQDINKKVDRDILIDYINFIKETIRRVQDNHD
jgi:uncharacterized protein YjcR